MSDTIDLMRVLLTAAIEQAGGSITLRKSEVFRRLFVCPGFRVDDPDPGSVTGEIVVRIDDSEGDDSEGDAPEPEILIPRAPPTP